MLHKAVTKYKAIFSTKKEPARRLCIEKQRRRYASWKVYTPRWIPLTTPFSLYKLARTVRIVSRHQYFTVPVPFSYVPRVRTVRIALQH